MMKRLFLANSGTIRVGTSGHGSSDVLGCAARETSLAVAAHVAAAGGFVWQERRNGFALERKNRLLQRSRLMTAIGWASVELSVAADEVVAQYTIDFSEVFLVALAFSLAIAITLLVAAPEYPFAPTGAILPVVVYFINTLLARFAFRAALRAGIAKAEKPDQATTPRPREDPDPV
jgi:hypothetical protein